MREPNQEFDVAITDIEVRSDRVTPVDERAVQLILQSAKETGHIRDAIHLRKLKKGYALIDGRHRLEVAKLLGHASMKAKVWECTLEQARLMEADANVTFTHMSPVDLAVSLAERKRFYVKLHPETAKGTAGGLVKPGEQRTLMSFVDFIAQVHDVTPRQIRRIVSAGEALTGEDVIALRKAPTRVSMKDLYVLAKISEPTERYAVVKSLAAGEAKNASAARKAYAAKDGAAPVVKDPVEDAFKGLLTAWRRAPKAAQRRFVETESAALWSALEEFGGGLSE